MSGIVSVNARNFARSAGAMGHPTMAEEFDAHDYKMKVKYESKHGTTWYDKPSGRNIFRYDTMFPETSNEYRPTIREHESELFRKSQWKKRHEGDLRRVDVMRLIKLKEQLKKAKGERIMETLKQDPQSTQNVPGTPGKSRGLEDEMVDLRLDEELSVLPELGFEEYMKSMKQKADIKKVQNYSKMDELIQKLGFLDYRDFLAINKYIIESKKASDYHIYARGQVLAAAMRK